ncbi:hypothetical protein [Rhizobium indicum]|uniref:hypothetical protein n=1 Tax=Rhizobium indicum TaxID=2583231 RepID=UPI001FE3E0E3|nr:hypothetical protein [Rhizobium indicum]
MTIEELIYLREAGARARVLGLAGHENAYLSDYNVPKGGSEALGDRLALLDALKYGWKAEKAGREGNLVTPRQQSPARASAPRRDLTGLFTKCLTKPCLIAFCAVATPSVSSAQSIEGFRLGDDKIALQRLGEPSETKADGAFTTLSFHGSDGVDLEATYQKPSNLLVALQATWPKDSAGPSTGYGDLTFGETSLTEIRSQMGSRGILYGSKSPVVASSNGTIDILSYFDVSGTDTVATFVTSIDSDQAARLKATFGADAYKNAPAAAKLTTISVSRREYLEKSHGTRRTLDIGYRAISWTSQEATSKHPAISLARIKPGQLPVFRTYSGPNNFPDFTGRDNEFSNFRTRITDGMSGGPSFAGEYSVIQIGCGTGCSFAYVGNNRTGQVFDVPVGGEDNMYLSLRYQLDSRLLVAQWADYDASKCYVQFFGFDDGEWTDLLKHEVGTMDDCFKTIAENVR